MTASKTYLRQLFVLLLLFFTTTRTGFTQTSESLTFHGFFNGMNLNIQCRESVTSPWIACECFDSIAVNGITHEDILYIGYQVDLANKSNLQLYDSVWVTFYYPRGCNFRILNPNEFLPKEILPVSNFSVTDTKQLVWNVKQNYPDLKLWVQIEQFKWDDWIKIGPNVNITSEQDYQFDLTHFLNKGTNKFRAVVATIDGQRIVSENIIEVKHKGKKIKVNYDAETKKILLSRRAHYELYDANWRMVFIGIDSVIDASRLRAEEYHLRYGNQQMTFLATP